MADSTRHRPAPLAPESDEQLEEAEPADALEQERPQTPASIRFWKQRQAANARALTLKRENTKLTTEVGSLGATLVAERAALAKAREMPERDEVDKLRLQLSNRDHTLFEVRHEVKTLQKELKTLQKAANENTVLRQEVEASKLALDYSNKSLEGARNILLRNTVQQAKNKDAQEQNTIQSMRTHIETQEGELRRALMKVAVLTGKVRQLESNNTHLLLDRRAGRSSSLASVQGPEAQRVLPSGAGFSTAYRDKDWYFTAPYPSQPPQPRSQQLYPSLDNVASRKRKYLINDAPTVAGAQVSNNQRFIMPASTERSTQPARASYSSYDTKNVSGDNVAKRVARNDPYPPQSAISHLQYYAPGFGQVARSASTPAFALHAFGGAEEEKVDRLELTPYSAGRPFPDLGHRIEGFGVAHNIGEEGVRDATEGESGDDGLKNVPAVGESKNGGTDGGGAEMSR